MMKKIVKLFGILVCILIIAACTSKTSSTAWLEGNWQSEEWSVIYTFKESEKGWIISGGDTVLTEGASLTQNEEGWVLTDSSGATFHIKKIEENRISFQQVASTGTLGTTTSVEFAKLK